MHRNCLSRWIAGWLTVVVLACGAEGQTDKPAPAAGTPASYKLAIPEGYVSRQTRIFVPNKPPYDQLNWAETLMGQVINPLVEQSPDLQWYWFSRYVQPVEGGENGDTDLTKIPKEFFVEIPEPKTQVHRSLRFRFCLPAKRLAEFEALGNKLISAQGCAIADWRDWDIVADLAQPRSLGEVITPERAVERAKRAVAFYHASSALTLHTLIGPDAAGYFRFEQNPNAPLGSSLETPHHVFCNMTDVPLCVLVTADDTQIHIGTFSRPPPPGKRQLGQVRIQF